MLQKLIQRLNPHTASVIFVGSGTLIPYQSYLFQDMFKTYTLTAVYVRLLPCCQVHLYKGKEIEDRCVSFIFEHGKDLLASRPFTRLCWQCVKQIVQSDELVVEEKLIFQAVLRWSEAECARKHMQVRIAL